MPTLLVTPEPLCVVGQASHAARVVACVCRVTVSASAIEGQRRGAGQKNTCPGEADLERRGSRSLVGEGEGAVVRGNVSN